MGIRCLKSFVKKYFRGWKKDQVKGKLIVDISAVVSGLYEKITAERATEENELCGGDYVSVSREVSNFFQALVDAGINPIVVLNGTFNYDKTNTIARRVDEKRKYIANMLAPEEERDHELEKQSFTARYLSTDATIDSVKRIVGDDHLLIPDYEADVDIACLAIHHQCPVLSNDSDFYIFPLLYGYIPYSKLHWSNTKGGVIYGEFYYYQLFCEQFGIYDELLLTVIPAIVGNDTIPKLDKMYLEMIMPQKDCTNDFLILEDAIKYVARFGTFDACLTSLRQEKLFGLIKSIQHAYREYFYLPLFKPRNSLATDLICKDGSSIPLFLLKKYRKGNFYKLVLDVLVYHKAHFSTAVEDMSQSWCCLIGVPIRRAIYGILCGSDACILESQRCPNATSQVEVEIKSITYVMYNEKEIPLPTFQSCGSELDAEYGKKILYGILNARKEDFENIPKDYQLLLAITRYWYKHCTINKKDILLNAFILLLQLSKECNIERSLPVRVPAKPLFPMAFFAHAFAQWQSLYRDIKILNQLLQEPLKLLQVSRFLECSYLYSLVEAMMKGGVSKIIEQYCLDQNIHQALFAVSI